MLVAVVMVDDVRELKDNVKSAQCHLNATSTRSGVNLALPQVLGENLDLPFL